MNPKWKKTHMQNMRNKRKGARARKSKKLAIPGSYPFTRYASSTYGSNLQFTLSNILTESPYNFTFALNKIQGFSDFTNLFDQYQIDKVDMYFRLVQNPDNTPQSAAATGAYYPCLWFIRDYDDDTAGGLSTIREMQGVKRIVLRPNVIEKISVTPKFQKMAYQTLTTTGYGPATGYLDCDDNAVPHYGLKTVMEVPISGSSWIVECNAKYHVSFRQPQ